MKNRSFGCIALLAAVAGPASHAQTVDVGAIDALIGRAVEQKKFVGLSAGVMHDGKVVLLKGYGFASIERREPVTEQTIFRIGSVTKQFTCVLALMQAEEGKYAMTDRVSRFFPDAARGGDISLLDLGNHVAGYRDYYPLDFPDRRMATPQKSMAIIGPSLRNVEFEPGSRFAYTNTGFLMLGDIIERADGAGYEDVLKKRVLARVAMDNTLYEPAFDRAGLATGYDTMALTAPAPMRPEARGWMGPAGGLWSTARDMLAWDLALMDGKLLSERSYRVLTTPKVLPNGRSTRYGCGIGVSERDGMAVLSHGGAVAGFTSRNMLLPTTRSAVVLLANRDVQRAALAELAGAIVGRLLPAAAPPPVVNSVSPLVAATTTMEQMQSGNLDRARLGAEFNAYLTADKLRSIATSMEGLGKPKSVEVEDVHERAGLEESTIVFKYERETLVGSMFRAMDGTIEQFLIGRR